MEQSQITGGIGGAAQGAATGAAVGGVPGAIIGGVIGGISGFLGGGGEKKAKRAAKKQAQAIMRQANENKRNETRYANIQVATARARTYASNIMDTGSTRKYRAVLESEYRRAIDYNYETAQQNAEAVRQAGQAAANQIQNAGFGQMISGLTSAGSAYVGGGFGSTTPAAAKPTGTTFDPFKAGGMGTWK
jgi:hypothetical protein